MLEEMKEKANYCLSCKIKPCQVGCPLQNDTTGFIKLLKEDKIHEAYDLLSETTVLQSICGRICPHDKQCQGSCIRGVSQKQVNIGDMEAYVGDIAIENDWKIKKNAEPKNKKIAVVGGGPTGLTCAATLAKNGYKVTIFEKHNVLGGIMNHGIPAFRLDKKLLQKAIDKILDLGIDVKLNTELGKDYTLNDLQKEYDAVYLGFGANLSSKMGIPGEDLDGVFGGNELLENNSHPSYKGKTVIVSGGGNVAMDTARTVKKLGAKEVIVIYRRSRAEMPAEKKEIEEAIEEGIEFLYQNNIIKICGDKKVNKIECVKTELVQKEGESRKSPVNIEGSNYFIDADYVIMAVGSKPEASLLSQLDVELDRRGRILIDKNNMTSKKGVFAGGDLAGAKGTVAWASRSGRDAGNAIINYLEKN
ncbi:MAG: FAD-dependent oxidoreductase [Clostridia bacterium]|nr:FAD-dependent oxidoreductase [Clostridia bacterium]